MGKGAGEGDELFLAGGEGGAAFGDGLGEGTGEGSDEVADVDLVGGVFELPVGDPGGAEADVVGDGAGEEEGVLEDDAEALAESVEILLTDVDAVDEDIAVLDVVEAHHQGGDGGFAGAGVADDGGGLARGDAEGDAAEDPLDRIEGSIGDTTGCLGAEGSLLLGGEGGVGEPNVAEFDRAGKVAGGGMRGRGDGGGGVEEFEDAL